jgi:hypothetical protein
LSFKNNNYKKYTSDAWHGLRHLEKDLSLLVLKTTTLKNVRIKCHMLTSSAKRLKSFSFKNNDAKKIYQ